jgi:hypothetical protein
MKSQQPSVFCPFHSKLTASGETEASLGITSQKRSTPNLQLSTTTSVDYAISSPKSPRLMRSENFQDAAGILGK